MRIVVLCMAFGAAFGAGVAAASGTAETSVQGTLKCLTPGGKLRPVADCASPTSEYVLESEDGKVWRFHSDDPRTRIFSEPRVRNEPLHVIGRIVGGSLEIIDLHIVRAGGHLLPHYHCDVCNITAYAPGPCWCCQQPFEFRLRPADRETNGEERP